MKTFVLNCYYTGAVSWEEWVQSRKPNWKFVVLLFFIRSILLLQTYQICLICRHIYYAYQMPFLTEFMLIFIIYTNKNLTTHIL